MAKAEPLFTFWSYLKYRFRALGPHGIHSPFMFGLYNEVLRPVRNCSIQEIENVRKNLLKNRSRVDITDFKTGKSRQTKVAAIARKSLSQRKFAAVLRRIVPYLNINRILETGTSLGLTAAYMAYGQNTNVISVEGNEEIVAIAEKVFSDLHLQNISVVGGTLDEKLTQALEDHRPELIFLDAEHLGTTLMASISEIKKDMTHVRAIVIHDIYWSSDMNRSWRSLVEDPLFPCTLDIFQAGVLFPNINMEKQHFILKF